MIGIGTDITSLAARSRSAASDPDAAVLALLDGVEGGAYDFTRGSTLWTNTPGTDPAAISDPVRQADDLSADAEHLTCASDATRPTRLAAGLQFTGLQRLGNTYGTPTTPYVFACIRIKRAPIDGNYYNILETANSSDGAWAIQQIPSTLSAPSSIRVRITHTGQLNYFFSIPEELGVLSVQIDNSAGTPVVARWNGSPLSADNVTGSRSNTGNFLHSSLTVGARSSGSMATDMEASRLWIGERLMTAGEVGTVEEWVGA